MTKITFEEFQQYQRTAKPKGGGPYQLFVAALKVHDPVLWPPSLGATATMESKRSNISRVAVSLGKHVSIRRINGSVYVCLMGDRDA